MVGGRYLKHDGTKKTHVGIHTAYRGIKGLTCNFFKDKQIALLIVFHVVLHCWLSPLLLFVVVGRQHFSSLFIFVVVVGLRHRQSLLFIVSKFLMSIAKTNFHLIVFFITQASLPLFVIVVGLCCCCWLLSVVIVSCHCLLLILFIIVIVCRLSRSSLSS